MILINNEDLDYAKKEDCTHENTIMVYERIPGEFVEQPIGEQCVDCGCWVD